MAKLKRWTYLHGEPRWRDEQVPELLAAIHPRSSSFFRGGHTGARRRSVSIRSIARLLLHERREPSRARGQHTPGKVCMTCEPTEAECRRRWDLTRHWRETEGINTILMEPQPNFHYRKHFYPHYHAGRGKDGHYVYYERPGELDLRALKEKWELTVGS